MLIAVVRFELENSLSPDRAKTLFRANSQLYEGREDLKQKSYIRSLDGRTVGAIYFWRSLDDAKAFYSPEWHAHVEKKYGTRPAIAYFDSPHVIDNR